MTEPRQIQVEPRWRWISDTDTPGVFYVQRERREVAMVSFADRVRYPAVIMERIVTAMADLDEVAEAMRDAAR